MGKKRFHKDAKKGAYRGISELKSITKSAALMMAGMVAALHAGPMGDPLDGETPVSDGLKADNYYNGSEIDPEFRNLHRNGESVKHRETRKKGRNVLPPLKGYETSEKKHNLGRVHLNGKTVKGSEKNEFNSVYKNGEKIENSDLLEDLSVTLGKKEDGVGEGAKVDESNALLPYQPIDPKSEGKNRWERKTVHRGEVVESGDVKKSAKNKTGSKYSASGSNPIKKKNKVKGQKSSVVTKLPPVKGAKPKDKNISETVAVTKLPPIDTEDQPSYSEDYTTTQLRKKSKLSKRSQYATGPDGQVKPVLNEDGYGEKKKKNRVIFSNEEDQVSFMRDTSPSRLRGRYKKQTNAPDNTDIYWKDLMDYRDKMEKFIGKISGAIHEDRNPTGNYGPVVQIKTEELARIRDRSVSTLYDYALWPASEHRLDARAGPIDRNNLDYMFECYMDTGFENGLNNLDDKLGQMFNSLGLSESSNLGMAINYARKTIRWVFDSKRDYLDEKTRINQVWMLISLCRMEEACNEVIRLRGQELGVDSDQYQYDDEGEEIKESEEVKMAKKELQETAYLFVYYTGSPTATFGGLIKNVCPPLVAAHQGLLDLYRAMETLGDRGKLSVQDIIAESLRVIIQECEFVNVNWTKVAKHPFKRLGFVISEVNKVFQQTLDEVNRASGV